MLFRSLRSSLRGVKRGVSKTKQSIEQVSRESRVCCARKRAAMAAAKRTRAKAAAKRRGSPTLAGLKRRDPALAKLLKSLGSCACSRINAGVRRWRRGQNRRRRNFRKHIGRMRRLRRRHARRLSKRTAPRHRDSLVARVNRILANQRASLPDRKSVV